MTTRKVFLSYARLDKDYLGELVAQLSGRLQTTADPRLVWWFDKQEEVGIQVGEKWAETLDEMIKTCDVFCLLATPNSVGISENCKQELAQAQQYQRPIAQIRVSGIKLPLRQYSQLPNRSIWIASEDSRGKRDEIWLEVVDGLAQTRPARWLDENVDAGVIAEFRDAVGELYDFKVFHDLIHKFLEKELGTILAWLRPGTLVDDDDLDQFLADIAARVAQLNGHAKSAKRRDLLNEMDESWITHIGNVFNMAQPAIDAYIRAEPPKTEATTDLRRALSQMARQLGRPLSHFNERMYEKAEGLNVSGFHDSLQKIVQERAQYQARVPDWKLKSRYTELSLSEHNNLQTALDTLLRFLPESFCKAANLDRFLEGFGKIQPSMQRLSRHWAEDQTTSSSESASLLARPKLQTKYQDLEAVITQVQADRANPALINNLQTQYAEFLRGFRDYFVDFDEEFKQTTKQFKHDLDGVTI